MHTSNSLSKKVLLYLAVVLTLQLVFISALVYLQISAEEQTRRAHRASKMANLVSSLSSEVFTMITAVQGGGGVLNTERTEEVLGRCLKNGVAQFSELKALTMDNAVEHQEVVEAEKIMVRGLTILQALKEDYARTGDAGDLGRLKLWNQMRQISSRDLFKKLNDVGAQEELIVEQDPMQQAAMREKLRWWLFGFLAMTLISILALARYLIGNITSRLGTMHDNTYRLASNLPLNKPLRGADEIAELDRTFHNMAALLREAAEKERAIVENAIDVICSFDDEGRFLTANTAVEKLLGYRPQQLIGKPIVELIAEEDLTDALQYFSALQDGKEPRPLEIKLLRKNGESVHTLWSAHWSEQENSLFCVIHDTTLRKEAERMKEEIMAMVNHDLRTPLTTVQVSVELLKANERARMSPRGQELIEKMAKSCDQVMRLTQDLLDLDKIESGRLELDIESCNIGMILSRAIEISSGLAHNQNINVLSDLQNLSVEGDKHRLEQIAINILTNALKFSPAGSSVYVSVRPGNDGRTARVSIQDQGLGISPAMQEKVFDRYKQLPGDNASRRKGSGLGLAICKALVEQHGGKIWVESVVGKGANFVFTIPSSI